MCARGKSSGAGSCSGGGIGDLSPSSFIDLGVLDQIFGAGALSETAAVMDAYNSVLVYNCFAMHAIVEATALPLQLLPLGSLMCLWAMFFSPPAPQRRRAAVAPLRALGRSLDGARSAGAV